MANKIDLSGIRFGRLIAKRRAERRSSWVCRCDCGNIATVRCDHLKEGRVKSCGCLNKELAAAKIRSVCTTHGMTNTPEFRIWRGILARCYNPKNISYPNYGGRGIVVCQKWENSFAAFFADMGRRPSSRHTMDRIDNSGNYTPENCRWSTWEEQHANKRNSRKIAAFGKTLNAAAWARLVKIPRNVIYNRVFYLNWPPEKALTIKVS